MTPQMKLLLEKRSSLPSQGFPSSHVFQDNNLNVMQERKLNHKICNLATNFKIKVG